MFSTSLAVSLVLPSGTSPICSNVNKNFSFVVGIFPSTVLETLKVSEVGFSMLSGVGKSPYTQCHSPPPFWKSSATIQPEDVPPKLIVAFGAKNKPAVALAKFTLVAFGILKIIERQSESTVELLVALDTPCVSFLPLNNVNLFKVTVVLFG